MLCLLEPLRSASGYGIFQRLPYGIIRPEFSEDPVTRPLSGDTYRCPSLPLIGAQWKVLGPEPGDPGSGLSSVTRSELCHPGSSSVLSSKTGRLDQSSGRLEGPARFSAP